MLKNYKNKVRGFTLLELVIVIAVIGILAVIVLPSMLSALAKARDSKRMSEVRGTQTFLQVSGIDSSLRYPNNSTDLVSWYTATGNRPPVQLQAANAGEYKYQGVDCATGYAFKVGSLTVANTDTTCASYQLWVELEQRAVALSLDADLKELKPRSGTFNAASAASGVAANWDNTAADVTCTAANGPCVKAPANTYVAQFGDEETCASNSTTVPDCVFDLVP